MKNIQWMTVAATCSALALSFFAGGVVLSGAYWFAETQPAEFIIDLLAATGTWAVGIGAYHFARASHQLNVDNTAQAARVELRKMAAHHIAWQADLVSIQVPAGAMQKACDDFGATVDRFDARAMLDLAESFASNLPEPSVPPHVVLRSIDRSLFAHLKYNTRFIRGNFEKFIASYSSLESATPAMTRRFVDLVEALPDLANDARQALERSDKYAFHPSANHV